MDQFKIFLLPVVGLVFGIISLMLLVFTLNSIPIFQHEGVAIYTTNIWKASEVAEEEFYGILSAIYGTIYTSTIAITISLPISIGLAVFVADLMPRRLKELLIIPTDIMAGLPTILYGIWGVFVLVPTLAEIMKFLHGHFSFIPLFSYYNPTGFSYLSAGVLLAIMVTPFATSLIREAYMAIPNIYREAVYSLGLTRFEATKVLLNYIKPAIIAGTLLAFGRAVGETVAVSLVIGNAFNIDASLFAPGYTISSLIANQFGNAFAYKLMPSALFSAGLALFTIGLIVNIAGLIVLKRWGYA
ncbi:MAG: phosphate ABC transporter permease subunit PstC [Archaeoglobaceae archaeon]